MAKRAVGTGPYMNTVVFSITFWPKVDQKDFKDVEQEYGIYFWLRPFSGLLFSRKSSIQFTGLLRLPQKLFRTTSGALKPNVDFVLCNTCFQYVQTVTWAVVFLADEQTDVNKER